MNSRRTCNGSGERFASEGNRLGYFASLYGLMTGRVAEGLATGRFEDGERMQRLACHSLSCSATCKSGSRKCRRGWGILDTVGGRKDETIVNFSLRHARDAAWRVATSFSTLTEPESAIASGALDEQVAKFARKILWPGILVSAASVPIACARPLRPLT